MVASHSDQLSDHLTEMPLSSMRSLPSFNKEPRRSRFPMMFVQTTR